MNATPPPHPLTELSFAARMAQLRPSAIREILKTTESPEVISFAGGLPAPELFPIESFRSATQSVLENDGTRALQYGVTEGYAPLREWIAAHLHAVVGLQVDAARVLITQGSQQGLDLLAKIFIDPGDVVLVENPAYLGAIQAFQAYQAKIVGLPADSEGLRADALRAYLESEAPRPKFLYLICNYQNPTGTSTTDRRRKEIAAIAKRHGVLVVEDDPYGRLRYEGTAAPSLAADSDGGAWAYLGSTSKVLAPGLRVGWLATSEPKIHERLVTAKQASDLHTGSFTQRLVYRLLSDANWFDGHVAKLCRVYGARRDTMLRALERELPPGCSWTRPEGGLFLWIELPATIDSLALLKKASSHKVAFVPGAPFWVDELHPNTLRLNFSNATEDRIEEGVRRLGRLIKAEI